MNKAKRGELKKPVPIGYLYSEDQLIKDPDLEVQNSVEMLFDSFRRIGSIHGVVQYFKRKGYKFPYKPGKGFRRGDVEWIDLAKHTVDNILHNPCYAGVYSYGECQWVWTPNGKKIKKMPREDWHVFIKDHHIAYVSYEEFETNERILWDNYAQRRGAERKTPPREGSALLQGLAWCGICGCRMQVNYSWYKERHIPRYICPNNAKEHSEGICQSMSGQMIDAKIGELLVNKLTPEVIAQSAAVQKELDCRQDETLNYYRMREKKCKYEAELARSRFMNVDPLNRLVALELESAWNIKLKNLDDARNEFDEQAQRIERMRYERDYSLMENLSDNFAEMFQSGEISHKDKKRMVRYLIEDVTLSRNAQSVLIQIRYKGNTTQSVTIDAPLRGYETWITDPEVVKMIDNAAETATVENIVALLNQKGFMSGTGMPFNRSIVKHIMHTHSIPTLKDRYLDRGFLTSTAKAASMGITTAGLMSQIRSGRYPGEYVCVNSRNEYVFPPEKGKEVGNA
ncbi:MAG: recombinase family protein [Clostridiales bacterium]|nr:recombinase family protein [Clostridiales bacterium]